MPNVLPNVGLTRRILAVAVALGALGAGVAACGGGSSSASSGSPTTSVPATTAPNASRAAALQKYTQCLTSHGVPSTVAGGLFGRRPGGTSGSSSGAGSGSTPTSRPAGTRPTIPAQYQAAFQACNSLRPTFGGGGFGAGGGGFNSATFAAYRNCLTIHGVTLPTTPTTKPGQTPPTSGAGRAGIGSLANNPKFQAAAKACASLLPARTGSSASTTVPAAQ